MGKNNDGKKPPLRKKQFGDYHYKIPMDQLASLVSMQCTDEEIAAFFGCERSTIERRKKDPVFFETYHNAKAKGRISLRRMLFKSAEGTMGPDGKYIMPPDGRIQIWLSKQYLGMRDVTALEHSGPQGAAIESVATVRIEYVNSDDEKNVDSDD